MYPDQSKPSHNLIKLTFNLFDRTREPLSSRDQPESQRVGDNDPDRDHGIVQSLRVDRIDLRENERDRDKDNPEDGCKRNGVGECA